MELVYTATNGCNSAKADEGLIRQHVKGDYGLTDVLEDADVVILLGCGVTKYAADDSKKWYQRLCDKSKDGARVIMSGCASLMDYSVGEGVDEKDVIPIRRIKRDKGIDGIVQIGESIPRYEAHGRLHIKTNSGCDDACSYCAIPFARGRLRSYPIEGIVDVIKRYVGSKENAEIGFVGEDIGAYGVDIDSSVVDLLREVQGVKGNFSLRIEVINPRWFVEYEELSDVLIEMAQEGRLNPGIGIPLQSASNKVLAAMRRKHTVQQYQEIIDRLNGQVSVSTDILVGFPGESENDFRETFAFLRGNPFGSPFGFYQVMGYSDMPKTRASRMKGKVPEDEIRRRMKVISTLLMYQVADARRLTLEELTDLPISMNHENVFGER